MFRTSLVLATLLLAGCNLADREAKVEGEAKPALAEKADAGLEEACASEATNDRLKELAFDEAARIRGDDAQALDQVAETAVVRMENPVMQDRDEGANVTLCSGRFVLELPEGTQNAFDGERRITADIEYAAQNAEDGSGLVYQMEGAEPIIYRLATVGGLARGQAQALAQAQARSQQQARAEPVTIPQASAPPGAPRRVVQPPAAAPAPAPRARPEPETRRPVQQAEARRPVQQAEAAPQRRPEPTVRERPARAEARARPSFNCRYARTRTEQMVCSNGGLAAQDRRMASAYYDELAEADAETRQRLRRSRNRFLARRERCRDEACVSAAYAEREAEIRRISGGAE